MKLHIIKTRLLITLFICQAGYSFGQYGLSFKIYQNTDLFQQQYHIPQPRENINQDKINFSRISLAFGFRSGKSYFHEVELQIPEFSRPLGKLDFPQKYSIWKGDAYDQIGSSFSCRYELGKLLGDKSKPINLLLSTCINPYYIKLEYTPTVPNAYYYSLTHYGLALNVVPRLYFRLNRLFSIDLNSPIRIYDFRRSKYRQDNPILPLQQQRSKQIDHLFFESVYTIRIGLMYSLGNIKF